MRNSERKHKLRLNEERIDELIKLHKKIKDKQTAVWINTLVLWGKGWEWDEINEALLISDMTIRSAVEKYKENGLKGLIEKKYKTNRYKLTEEQEKELSEYVETYPINNSNILCKWVRDKFEVKYSHNGIIELLNRLGFVYKKQKGYPGKLPPLKVQKAFAEKITELEKSIEENNKHNKDKEALYFMDGSGFYHNVKLQYIWVKKGKEKRVKTNTGRRKLNVNGAYNPSTEETISVEQETSVNQQSNIALIDKIINTHSEYKRIHIVLDNATYNKGKMFREHIKKVEKQKNIKIGLTYTPPYSPNLNLIERLWKYAKKKLLTEYYEQFSLFKEVVIDFFENRIKKKHYREELSKFIGTDFQLIEA